MSQATLLIVDMQNYCAHPKGGEFERLSKAELNEFEYLFSRLPAVTANISKLLNCFRDHGGEVMYCVIESQTQDGRDLGLDYKITGFHVPKGSWDAKVIDALAPQGDEIVIPKTSSSVFNSTNIDYVLRALGMRQVVVVGIATDQCVEGAMRDACDLGYLVTLINDACATYSDERQRASECAIKGYCRIMATDELVSEIETLSRELND